MQIAFPGNRKPPTGVATRPAPRGLGARERKLWTEILAEFNFTDSASLALLEQATFAAMRARRCRELVNREGEIVRDRFGQQKPHPALAAERDSRAGFLAAMRALGLDRRGDE